MVPAIDLQTTENLPNPGWPGDLYPVDTHRPAAETRPDAGIASGRVAARAAAFEAPHERPGRACGLNLHPGSVTVAVAAHALQMKCDPMARGALVAQEHDALAVVDHGAIIVAIAP